MGKRVSIVFEETLPGPGGVGFNVSLEGASYAGLEAMGDRGRREHANTAEFWAFETMVRGVLPLLKASGAYRGITVQALTVDARREQLQAALKTAQQETEDLKQALTALNKSEKEKAGS